MSKRFLLAFGGTGARVAESVCYLQAAGFIRDPLHVLIIDPDGANGNVVHARRQLERYVRFHKHFDSGGVEGKGGRAPFDSPLNPGFGEGSVFWEYPNTKKPFRDLLGVAGLPDDQQALLKLLYDDSDLDRTFEIGYVGRAHVGSLDLYRTIKEAMSRLANGGSEEADQAIDQFFGALRAEAQSGHPRLLVTGSVFGGTGASGVPTIPALLKELLPTLRSKVVVGGLLYGPYFTFGGGGDDDPDSALHPLATRAALYHYASTHVGFDTVLFLGAPSPKETNKKNVPGGALQRNQAHYAELAGAAAADHFFSAPEAQVRGGQVLTSGATEVSWAEFPGTRQDELRQKMAAFTAASLFHAHFAWDLFDSGSHADHPWATKVATDQGKGLGGKEDELKEFRVFARRYLDWVRDVGESVVDADGHQLLGVPRSIDAASLGSILKEPQRPDDPFDRFFRILNQAPQSGRTTAFSRYLDMLGHTSVQFCDETYRSWSWGS